MKNLKERDPRILHLISSSGFLGAENVVLELSKELTKLNHWVTIGILETRDNRHMELAERAREAGVNVQLFPCQGRFDKRTITAVRDFIVREKPSVLHSHGYKANFYFLLANRGRLPWIVTNHLWKRTNATLKIYAHLDSLVMRKADCIVAVSEQIANDMKQRGIAADKVAIIENGVSLERFRIGNKDEMRKAFGFNGNEKVIGTVASLTPEKGHTYLIDAAREVIHKHPEARFLIIGDGPQRQSLEETTAHLGLSGKVIFTGSRKDIPEILSLLDAFVLPSFKEGLPMALLEAMAAKVPVIATKVGAVPKLIEDGVSGILIPPKDPQAIADAAIEVLSDEQGSLKMARKGFERVRDHYSSATMAQKYLALYNDLLS